jgi:Xaa-Pro aminopeptidase
MAIGGAMLVVSKWLKDAALESAFDIEKLACELIKKEGAEPSFKKVPGYSWATCISVNEGLVHGIPTKELVFKDGDLVSVDVGIYHKGFPHRYQYFCWTKSFRRKQKVLGVGKLPLKGN